jgi:hypothetical protein
MNAETDPLPIVFDEGLGSRFLLDGVGFRCGLYRIGIVTYMCVWLRGVLEDS